MAKYPMSESSGAKFSRMQRIKLMVAAGVIVLCAVWLGYFMLANRPVTEIPATTPVQRFQIAAAPVFENERFERVIMTGAEDGKSMTVSGSVVSQAELDELKKGLEEAAGKVAAQGDPIELKWDVKVAGK